MEERFQEWLDPRTKAEIALSNHLIDKLSDLNMQMDLNRNHPPTCKNRKVVVITINGIPRDDNEWAGFTFPGTVVNYVPPGFQVGKSHEFYEERLKKSTMKDLVAQIDQIVDSHGPKVLFACHSFGSFAATAYAHFHPQKVVGMMQFGGIPLRFYRTLKTACESPLFGMQLSLKQFLKYRDKIYEAYTAEAKGLGNLLIASSYNLIAFILIMDEETIKDIFKWRRDLPRTLLKLIVFGRKDTVSESKLLNQMAVHFAFGEGCVQPATNQRLWKQYLLVTGTEAPQYKNIQERFVYSYPNTGHGPHLTKKTELQNIMNLYTSVVLESLPPVPNL